MAVQIEFIGATDSNDSVTFSPTVKIVTLINKGADSVFINLNGAATTSHFRMEPEETLIIGLSTITTVQAICDTGETATLNIIGEE